MAEIEEQFKDQPMMFSTEIPQGATADASGFLDPPIGYNLYEIADFEIVMKHPHKDSKETYVAAQLRPRLRIPDGQPLAGATIMDFLPMPLAGETVSTRLMNRWLNFLKAAGFVMPNGPIVVAAPPGFSPVHLKGKRLVAKTQYQTDADKQVMMTPEGSPRLQIAFFGYYPESRLAELRASAPAGPAKADAKPKVERTIEL
jgi:hypothetical protein